MMANHNQSAADVISSSSAASSHMDGIIEQHSENKNAPLKRSRDVPASADVASSNKRSQPSDRSPGRAQRVVFVLIDGLADVSVDSLGDKTPMESAKMPTLDDLCGTRSLWSNPA